MLISKKIQRPQRVLVVDDQELNRDVLGMILEDDYEVTFACNGEEALREIEANSGQLSLVMLDLMMPVMNGFEVLERMNKDERMRSIPVIVLTADKNAELRALEMGASDFITKPFDIHEVILARVGRIIELCEGRQLIQAAERDPLTGLYSHNFFFEYANRLYHYHPELRMDAFMLNVERFHTINALNGRDFGDLVLRTIGDEVRAYLTEHDGIACRTDGDRFQIYCAHDGDYSAFLRRFQDKVNQLSSRVNIHLRLGVKPGIPQVDPVLMFDRARAACNMARGDYQNPIRIYNDEMLEKELLHQRLLNDLHAAVEEQQFEVYYQPKYYIQHDPPQLGSAEALVRWRHPELGMISPGEFIPLFESNGLISVVDSFVWQKAARQIVEWRRKYGFTLPVSVNLSRSDIFDPSLVDRIRRLVEDNGLSYKDLKLEVTESAYTDDAARLLSVIGTLREIGFDVEMDDFGAGYSSLNMLSAMPVDVLKMDMRFVRNIESSETDRRLVKLILDIAKHLGVPVVAEGVETEGQLSLLKDDGCDIVQGFYFSRPLPAADFEKLMEEAAAAQ